MSAGPVLNRLGFANFTAGDWGQMAATIAGSEHQSMVNDSKHNWLCSEHARIHETDSFAE